MTEAAKKKAARARARRAAHRKAEAERRKATGAREVARVRRFQRRLSQSKIRRAERADEREEANRERASAKRKAKRERARAREKAEAARLEALTKGLADADEETDSAEVQPAARKRQVGMVDFRKIAAESRFVSLPKIEPFETYVEMREIAPAGVISSLGEEAEVPFPNPLIKDCVEISGPIADGTIADWQNLRLLYQTGAMETVDVGAIVRDAFEVFGSGRDSYDRSEWKAGRVDDNVPATQTYQIEPVEWEISPTLGVDATLFQLTGVTVNFPSGPEVIEHVDWSYRDVNLVRVYYDLQVAALPATPPSYYVNLWEWVKVFKAGSQTAARDEDYERSDD